MTQLRCRRQQRSVRQARADRRGVTAQDEYEGEKQLVKRTRVPPGAIGHVSAVSSLRPESGHTWARRCARQQEECNQKWKRCERQQAVVRSKTWRTVVPQLFRPDCGGRPEGGNVQENGQQRTS
eukprot:5140063-Pleurochrysis_carterae.AAC.2